MQEIWEGLPTESRLWGWGGGVGAWSRITLPNTSSTSAHAAGPCPGASAPQLQSQSNPPRPASSPAWSRGLKAALGLTDRGLMDRGLPMASPGQPCTDLRVSPIELLGKAVLQPQILDLGSDRSRSLHQTRVPAGFKTGDFDSYLHKTSEPARPLSLPSSSTPYSRARSPAGKGWSSRSPRTCSMPGAVSSTR